MRKQSEFFYTKYKFALVVTLLISGMLIISVSNAARMAENLDRGIVAVRTNNGAFISWRLFGTDPSNIGFNLYRSTSGNTPVKLNSSVLTNATCYTDTNGNFSLDNSYFVKPVISNIEQDASGSFTLSANTTAQPCIVVPLSSGNTDEIHFVWVGDLDGDGEYDYIVDRLNWEGRPQSLEAYHRNGTLMWSIDLGPNSTNTYNIEPGSSTIDVGHWDGVTVYDLDSDGIAEVIVKTANGVTFANGAQVVDNNNNRQYISVINGFTGIERARIQIPTDYIADGPLAAHLGIGYLNGHTPSIVACMKNRIGSGSFNMMVCAWDYNGYLLTEKWKWLRGSQNCPDGHQIRVVDVDLDGKDEICEIGFVIDDDGSLLYSLGPDGIVHGDRFHIGKFNPDSSQLYGYAVQQDNASGLLEFFYNATTGDIIWENVSDGIYDIGRGDVGDIDPGYPGYECWSFNGVYNGPTGSLITDPGIDPYPVLRLWWDGDDFSEIYNDGKIEKWYYGSSSTGRLVTTWKIETATGSARGCPMFYGDIFGDWREEVIMTSFDYSKLVIFTTDIPTNRRIYTLPHNPEYRNCMTVKGYMQSHHVDFSLGNDMPAPPAPNIILVNPDPDETEPPMPNPISWNVRPHASSSTSIAMKASSAFDQNNVEYYFACTYGNGNDSGWQDSPAYKDTGLTYGQNYTYTVTARDNSNNFNMTFSSVPSTCILSTAPSVAHWDFEDGIAGSPLSSMPNGGSMDLNNTYIIIGYNETYGPSFAAETPDQSDLSVFCNGSQDGYTVDAALNSWSPQQWTIEVSIRLESLAGWNTFIGRDGSSNNESESDFYLQNNGIDDSFRINFDTVGGQRWVLDSDFVPNSNQWYNLALTSDGSTLKMYCDKLDGSGYLTVGTLDISAQTPARNALAQSGSNWTFGRGWYGGSFVDHIEGYIDNVRFSEETLSPDQFLGTEPEIPETYPWIYGDFSGNHYVDMDDFSTFSNFIMRYDLTSLGDFDLDDDNKVGLTELIEFADNWLATE